MPAKLTLELAPTKAGLAEARLELDRFEQTLALEWAVRQPGETNPAHSPTTHSEEPVVAIYERSAEGRRSRELLELIGGGKENGLTPTELGRKMSRGPGGKALSKASVRAVLRNIQRVEGHLFEEGAISRQVLWADFARYDEEGAGRYFISDEDRRALDAHLGL